MKKRYALNGRVSDAFVRDAAISVHEYFEGALRDKVRRELGDGITFGKFQMRELGPLESTEYAEARERGQRIYWCMIEVETDERPI